MKKFYHVPNNPINATTLTLSNGTVIDEDDMFGMLLCDGHVWKNGSKEVCTDYGKCYNDGDGLMVTNPEGLIYMNDYSNNTETVVHGVNTESVKAALEWLFA